MVYRKLPLANKQLQHKELALNCEPWCVIWLIQGHIVEMNDQLCRNAQTTAQQGMLKRPNRVCSTSADRVFLLQYRQIPLEKDTPCLALPSVCKFQLKGWLKKTCQWAGYLHRACCLGKWLRVELKRWMSFNSESLTQKQTSGALSLFILILKF